MPALIIGNAPHEIRSISLKPGRTNTGPCQIQDSFDHQTYRAESFYSFHPWLVLCSVEELHQPLFSSRAPQKRIFTNISQLKTRSRRRCSQCPLECQLTVDFPASFFFRGIRSHPDSRITEDASPRKYKRESSLSTDLGYDLLSAPCNDFLTVSYTCSLSVKYKNF